MVNNVVTEPPSLTVVPCEPCEPSVPSCAYIRSRHKIVAFVRKDQRDSDLLRLRHVLAEFGFEFQLLENFIRN